MVTRARFVLNYGEDNGEHQGVKRRASILRRLAA